MKAIMWIFKTLFFGFITLYAINFVGMYFDFSLMSGWLSYLLIGALGPAGILILYIFQVLIGY